MISWLNPKTWFSGNDDRPALDERQRSLEDLADAPRKAIRDAKPGEVVQFEGRIRRDQELLDSPLGKRKCVFYDAHAVEEELGDEIGVVIVFSRREAADFYLEDSTGRVKICSDALKVDINFDFRKVMTASRLGTLLGYASPNSNSGSVRAEETTLAPDEIISICGLLQDEPDPTAVQESGGYRQGRPRRLILKAPPGQFILVTERRVEHAHEE